MLLYGELLHRFETEISTQRRLCKGKLLTVKEKAEDENKQ